MELGIGRTGYQGRTDRTSPSCPCSRESWKAENERELGCDPKSHPVPETSLPLIHAPHRLPSRVRKVPFPRRRLFGSHLTSRPFASRHGLMFLPDFNLSHGRFLDTALDTGLPVSLARYQHRHSGFAKSYLGSNFPILFYLTSRPPLTLTLWSYPR